MGYINRNIYIYINILFIMPTLQLFINDNQNKSLNVIKAKLELKSKRELIDIAINKYISEQLPELQNVN
jgi:hypothetical protein